MENEERYLEQIKELFMELSTTTLYDTWADTFDLEIDYKNRVIIAYQGPQPIKTFKKACKKTLLSCIYSVMGMKTAVKFIKKVPGKEPAFSPKTKKKIKAVNFFIVGMFFVCVATAIIIVLGNYIGNRNFRETFYNTSSIKVDSCVRVIQLSDLHTTYYGKDNKDLLDRIKALKPDIIICTGDIVDSTTEDIDYAVSLAEELVKIAPSYYIYGNNEVESIYGFPFTEEALDQKFGFNNTNRIESALLDFEDIYEDKLESVGMKVLKNEKDTVKVKTTNVDIYGVLNSNPSSFWSYSEKSFLSYLYEDTDNLKITAVHEPFIFEEFTPEFWGDLMLSGHTHGGLVRIPVIGPLYTNEGGLFPERNGDFVYGRYDVAGKLLVVSAGLENSNVLRVNNQPELVVIDINKF